MTSGHLDDLAARAAASDEVENALAMWAELADGDDNSEASLRLIDAERARRSSSDRQALAEERARLLLLLGRAQEAVAELAALGPLQLPDGVSVGRRGCTTAACLAATGNDRAYAWLQWAYGQVSSDASDWWQVGYLLAAAADVRDDRAVADFTWDALVDRGIRTRLTLAARAAGRVSARTAENGPATVAAAAASLAAHWEPGAEDAVPGLLAAARLERRKDSAGAVLLLTALVRRPGAPQVLRDALARLQPRGPVRRHLVLVRATQVAAVAVLVAVVARLTPGPDAQPFVTLTAVTGGLGVRLLPHRPSVPGLSRTDSQIWRAQCAVRFDRWTGTPTTFAGTRVRPAVLVSVLACLALAVTAGTTTTVDLAGGPNLPASRLAVLAGWVVAVGVLLGGLVTVRQVDVARAARSRGRRAEARRAELTRELSTCRCWQARRFGQREAELYLAQHLVPLRPTDPAVALVPHVQPLGAQIARCPQTQALWLSGPLATGGLPLLLRGPAPVPPAQTPQPKATGFYL